MFVTIHLVNEDLVNTKRTVWRRRRIRRRRSPEYWTQWWTTVPGWWPRNCRHHCHLDLPGQSAAASTYWSTTYDRQTSQRTQLIHCLSIFLLLARYAP